MVPVCPGTRKTEETTMSDSNNLTRIAEALERIAEAQEVLAGVRTVFLPGGKSTFRIKTEEVAPQRASIEQEKRGVARRATPARREEESTELKAASGQLLRAYCDAFKSRYGTRPVVDGKMVGLCKQVVLAVGSAEKACLLVQAYLQMEDRWFLTKCHDFVTFHQNMGKVAVSLASGTQDPHERKFWNTVFG
jgi:hypothetical protein